MINIIFSTNTIIINLNQSWFFNTEKNIEDDTTLTPYQQRKAVKVLIDNKLIEVKRKGIPAKQYFKINEEQVIKKLNNLNSINLTTINKNKEIRINNKYSFPFKYSFN